MGVEMVEMRPMLLYGKTSDHAMLLIELIASKRGNKPFKLYNSWLRNHTFNEMFKKKWETEIVGSPLFRLFHKIKMVKEGTRS